jgi:hypothetical protein
MHAAFENVMRTNPARRGIIRESAIACIEACSGCELACLACADACLAEPLVDMLRRCIQLNQACADICALTARITTRDTASMDVLRLQLQACAAICAQCRAECEKHAKSHEHCGHCAQMCSRCEEACQTLIAAVGAS